MNNRPQLILSPKATDESVRATRIDEGYSGCSWHFHRELQLCHVASGQGQRLIGDQVCPIEQGEVVLLGSNLPHVWRYEPTDSVPVAATVIHFHADILGNSIDHPELRDVRLLITRATQGLQAHRKLRDQLAQGIEDLVNKVGLPRILGLLELLHLMSQSNDVTTICSNGYQSMTAQLNVDRLRRVCEFVEENLSEDFTRDTVAQVVQMSGSGFSRFFKSHTGVTFQEYVADVRISRACELLASTQLTVNDIASECGFRELTTFNRAFKKIRSTTPTQYRSLVTTVASG